MITEEEIQQIVKFAKDDERFGVAFRGALSQIRHRLYLESRGYQIKVSQSDNRGEPDFIINGKRMEHKRARNETYSDGGLKAEFQKSRGKVPKRLYDNSFSDLVSVDVSDHTGVANDYRYARASQLRCHKDYPQKIASMQRIGESWTTDLKLLLENRK